MSTINRLQCDAYSGDGDMENTDRYGKLKYYRKREPKKHSQVISFGLGKKQLTLLSICDNELLKFRR